MWDMHMRHQYTAEGKILTCSNMDRFQKCTCMKKQEIEQNIYENAIFMILQACNIPFPQ